MPNIAVSQLSSHQPGEDYINKSLLDSLDAQADAEPISSSSESEQPAPASYGSNSSSSSGSPSAPYHFAVQPQQQQQQQPQHLTRSDSPSDNNNQAILHRLHSQDPLYNMHGQHSNYYPHSHSANNMHMTSEYGSEYDAQKQSQHSGKVNDSYKTSHGSYPITTRMRHHTNQHTALNSAQYRDTSSFYPSSAADVYPPTQVTSPIQSHMQPFDPRASYDFNGGRTDMGVGPKSYLMENYASSATIMQSVQQPGKPNVVQQTPLNGYASNGQYINGIQLSSQTPYGPHVPSNGHISAANGVSANAVGAPPGLSATSAMNMANGHGSSANQEEISTIFVVGFPDDMQEREFQNMFTFSPGFEAATLKIPNKEYTSYGGMAMNGVPAPLRSSYQGYTGSNDPYNLVTVNQGGVVVDGGRDGTMASWPSSTPIEENASNGNHFVGGINMAPRKQIIGFAKFKSREEALHARDVLQGRRVDIEKGAVLKAEMAKKNLHTKRGVGPVPTSLHGINGTVTNGPVSGTGSSSVIGSSNSLGGMQHNMINGSALGGSAGADVYGLGTNDSVSAREREYGAIGPVGLSGGGGRLNLWREQTHHEVASTSNGVLMNIREKDEEEKRRDREDIMNSMLGQGAGLRGPRGRAEDEERERRSREKEMRLRASNTTAFDPFHPVSISSATPSAISSRQSSGMNGVNGSTYMQPLSVGSSSGPSPLLGSAFPSHQFVSQPRQVHTQQQQDGIVGPWDKLTVNTAPGPSSSSQRSTSPPLRIHSHALMEGSRCYSPVVGETGHLYRENNEIQQQQYHAPSESSSSSIAGTQRTNANSSAEQSADSGTDGELDRASDGLALNTNDGNTSPQLPSPASGASSASVRNIVDQNPPINTLYVGNLPTSPPPLGFPQDYLEERLRDLFSIQPGYRRLLFRQKSNGPMCFVEFEDVQYATKALNDLYGNNLKGLIKGGGIRLSYSKNPLGVRTPTSAGSATGPSLQQQQNQISTNPLQSGGFPSENTSARVEEPPQQSQRLPSILRRESKALSPPVNNHTYTTNFLASPPRFHAVATGAASQYGAQPSATQLTSSSAAFVPRGTGNTFYSYSLAASNGLSASQSTPSFSPFAMSSPPTHSSIPDQSSSSEASHSS